jgi:hypothetical protein
MATKKSITDQKAVRENFFVIDGDDYMIGSFDTEQSALDYIALEMHNSEATADQFLVINGSAFDVRSSFNLTLEAK